MEWSKETFGIVLASIIGAFIGTATKRGDKPFAMFVSLVAGITSSYIFTPLVSDYINMSHRVDYAIAFMIGLVGMSLISIIMSTLEVIKDEPKDIIEFAKDYFLRSKNTTTTTVNNHYEHDQAPESKDK